MDVVVDRCGLDEILYRCQVMLLGTNPIGFAADFLVATKKNSFLFQLIHNLKAKSTFYGLPIPYLAILFSTGPIYIALNYDDYPHQEEICVLMPSLHEESVGSPLTFFSEVEGNSWYEWDALLIYYFKKHYILITLALLSFLFLLRYFYQIRLHSLKKDLDRQY